MLKTFVNGFDVQKEVRRPRNGALRLALGDVTQSKEAGLKKDYPFFIL